MSWIKWVLNYVLIPERLLSLFVLVQILNGEEKSYYFKQVSKTLKNHKTIKQPSDKQVYLGGSDNKISST